MLLDKGCCANYPLPKYSANIAIAQDVVHGVKVRVVSCRCVAMCVCARVSIHRWLPWGKDRLLALLPPSSSLEACDPGRECAVAPCYYPPPLFDASVCVCVQKNVLALTAINEDQSCPGVWGLCPE